MDFITSPAFLARYADHFEVVACVTATLLGSVVTFSPRFLASPVVDTIQKETAVFMFHNGVLLPHHEYLYEFSETGKPYILGKKLPGIDYSAAEARYAKSMGVETQTVAALDSDSKWSGWFGKPNAATISHFIQPLLWVLFGIFCALVVRWAWPKLAAKLSKWKNNAAEDTIAIPTGHIEEEYSKLNHIWRSTLIRVCREQKSEILALSKLAIHYINSKRHLKKLVAKERKKKGKVKSELAKLKAEHADKLAEQQREIDSLRQMLDTKTHPAQESENSNHAVAVEEKAESYNSQGLLSVDQPESPKETMIGLQDAVVDVPVESSEGEHGMPGAEGPRDEVRKSSTEQDDNSSAQGNQSAGPKLGMNGKPLIPRANTRSDGSIRTASHPGYVPLNEAPSRRGDRPFRGPGRGSRGRRGHGGGGRNGRARFGWRGGRGGGGRGEAGMHDGQFNQGRGQ
ncbi:MAG: hypothetical protein Q9175_001971 [Cornicularia normoerica]